MSEASRGGHVDALQRLIAPLRTDELLEHLYAGRLLRAAMDQPRRAAELFGWDDCMALLARDLDNGRDYRLFKAGRGLDAASLGALNRHGQLLPERLQALIRQGITVVGNRVERKHPALWALACEWQRLTGGQVTMAFVASIDCPKALPVHYDFGDNLVIQVEGRKHWSLYGSPIAGSGIQRAGVEPPAELSAEFELAPGDLLFVPSGLHHQCRSSGTSLHLSLLVEWPTALQVLEQLVARAAEDEVLAVPLRLHADPSWLAAQEKALKQRLVELVDAVELREILAALARKAALPERL